MPWPIKNRGIVCESAFFDCLDSPSFGSYIVFVGSVEPEERALTGNLIAAPRDTAKKNDRLGLSDSHMIGNKSCEQSARSGGGAVDAGASEPAKIPTSKEQCPRMTFESYTTFEPLTPDATGERTRWTFYFHRTDYQVSCLVFLYFSAINGKM